MAEQKQASQLRAYTVVRASANQLVVLDPAKEARHQQHACDEVVASLPSAERSGDIGAFLAGSYREFHYSSEKTVVTNRDKREPSFKKANAAPASSAARLPADDASHSHR